MFRRWSCLFAFAIVAAVVAIRADELQKQILHFPPDRAVGAIHTRPPRHGSLANTLYFTGDWQFVGEARGELAVAAIADVRLDVGKSASKDLSFLGALRPDDVQVMNLMETDLDDDGLKHVGRLTGLRLLNLNSTHITDAGIRHLTPLKHLQEIQLDAFGVDKEGFGVGDGALRAIALAKWTELESISLRRTKITDDGIAALAFLKSLTAVCIAGTAVTDAGLVHLKYLPRLESLSLGVYDEGAKITDDGLMHVGEMSHLKQLGLSGTRVTDEGLKQLAKLTSLESLCLDNTNVTDAGLAHLEPLVKLTTLRAHLENNISDVGASHLAKLQSLTSLTGRLNVTDQGLRALAELPQLQNLDLNGGGVTDEGVAHIARMKSLKNLCFDGCPITDAGMAALTSLENLDFLRLDRTRVTGDGLRQLNKLIKLRGLAVDFGMTANGFNALRYVGELKALNWLTIQANGFSSYELRYLEGLQELETLDIRELDVDDNAAVYIGGLTSLKRLLLSQSSLTDVGLARLSILRKLEDLTLSGRFTSRGLESLKRLKSLDRVQLASPYISRDDVQVLAAAVPTIRSASLFTYHGKELDEISVSDRDTFRREGTKEDRIKLDALEDCPPPELTVGDWINAENVDLTLEKLQGKVVLIDFWSTQRKGGLGILPKLEQLHEKFQTKGLVIIGIHATAGAAAMSDFVAGQKLPWAIAADVENASRGAWHISSYPSYFLIDRSGKLRFARIYRADLERAIKELLTEK